MLAVDIIDSIELLFEQKPDKRKKKEYQEWCTNLNELIESINKKTKIKMYDKVK